MNLAFLVDAALMFAAIVGAALVHDLVQARVIVALGGPHWPRTLRSRIDPFGTVVIPGVVAALGGPPFGYAAPVPLEAGRLRGGYRSLIPIALAGFATYVALAFAVGLIWRALGGGGWAETLLDGVFRDPLRETLFYFAFVPLVLAVLNVIPLPPLDGAKLLTAFLSPSARATYDRVGRYAPIILLALVLWFRRAVIDVAYDPVSRLLELFLGPP